MTRRDDVKAELLRFAENLEQGRITDSAETRTRMIELRDELLAEPDYEEPSIQAAVLRAGRALSVDREEAEGIARRDLPTLLVATTAMMPVPFSPDRMHEMFEKILPAIVDSLVDGTGWLTPDKRLTFKKLGSVGFTPREN